MPLGGGHISAPANCFKGQQITDFPFRSSLSSSASTFPLIFPVSEAPLPSFDAGIWILLLQLFFKAVLSTSSCVCTVTSCLPSRQYATEIEYQDPDADFIRLWVNYSSSDTSKMSGAEFSAFWPLHVSISGKEGASIEAFCTCPVDNGN